LGHSVTKTVAVYRDVLGAMKAPGQLEDAAV
jgi:hypothetical protein